MTLTLNSPEFTRTLNLADAYKVLYQFVEQYHARGESSTLALLSDLSLDVWADGCSADPAQLSNFLKVVDEVLKTSKDII